MNHIYRLVFNRSLGVMQVASELAARPGGGATAGGNGVVSPRRPLGLALALALAAVAGPGTAFGQSCNASPLQRCTDTEVFAADTADSFPDAGPAWSFHGASRLDAVAANAVNGGAQSFFDTSTLAASAANAVSGGVQHFYNNSTLNVLAADALTSNAMVTFDSAPGGVGGHLQLNGHGTAIGAIHSQSAGSGILRNGGASDATLTVDSSLRGDSLFSGLIEDGGSGRFALAKAGTGTLALTGANTYSGGTRVSDGTLAIGHMGALGTGDGEVTLSNGAELLATASGTGTFGRLVTSNGRVSAAAGETFTVQGFRVGGTLHIGSAGNTGTVVLSEATGSTVDLPFSLQVDHGTFRYGGAYAAERLTVANGTLRVAAGAAVDLHGYDVQTSHLAGDGRITSTAAGVSTLSIGGFYFGGGVSAASDSIFAGSIEDGAGTVALVKDGERSLTLTGTNTHTGGTTIKAGTLRLGDGGSTGSIAGNASIAAGAVLAFDRSDDITHAGTLSGAGTVSFEGAGIVTLAGANAFTGEYAIGAGHVRADLGLGGWPIASNNALSFDGGTLEFFDPDGSIAISYGGSRSVQIGGGGARIVLDGMFVTDTWQLQGSGDLVLDSGANSFYLRGSDQRTSGTTVVERGSFHVLQDAVLSRLTALDVHAGAAADLSSISVGSPSLATGALSGAGSVVLGGTLLEVGALGTSTTFAGTISGTGSLTKVGDGTLTLAGINTYSGGTAVNGGTLAVDGTVAGNVLVNAPGTLGGSGFIGGNVSVFGVLSPGSSPGTLAIGGNLVLNPGSTARFELGQSGVAGGAFNDLVRAGGDLALGGGLDVSAASAGWYRLFEYDGTLSGAFASESVNSSQAGFTVASHALDTGTAGEIGLSVLGAGQTLQFWDGTDTTGNGVVNGGSGTWSGLGPNWTDSAGNANSGWGGSVAVFTGSPGTVTVDGTQAFDTLQFLSDGYTVTGGTLALSPASGGSAFVNVDGGASATLGSTLADGTGTALTKVGNGTLILTGDGSGFSGHGVIAQGGLSVDGVLGGSGRCQPVRRFPAPARSAPARCCTAAGCRRAAPAWAPSASMAIWCSSMDRPMRSTSPARPATWSG